MTEDEYYAEKFTDAKLNCQADIGEQSRSSSWSTGIRWTNRPERRFGGILRIYGRRHGILPAMDRRLIRAEGGPVVH